MRTFACKRRRGFATAAVLALLAVVALLSVGALHDALFGEQLAGSRALHQRASVVAELGVQAAIVRLNSMESPAAFSFDVRPLSITQDSATVSIRPSGPTLPAQGFSFGRFVAQQYEVQSTAHTARGVRVTHTQGVVRMTPAIVDVRAVANLGGSAPDEDERGW
jgi:hypothetical protein